MSKNRSRNIAPNPQWSFAEVVEHAWEIYVGGGIRSGGYRNVLYRVWAAMVGADRAVAELDHFIERYENRAVAANAIGCAESTLMRLRRQFKAVNQEPFSQSVVVLSNGEVLLGKRDEYEVVEKIGAGGLGVVYCVKSKKSLDTFYAAKVLSGHRFEITRTVKARFLREASIAQNFASERVVRSIECFRHRGTLIVIMERLPGDNLHDRLNGGIQVKKEQRIDWVEQVVEGLAYLHKNQIVHRDLSPKNCLLREDDKVAIADFGVARRVGDVTVTLGHEAMGSLLYISPQQRENAHASSFSDDVFSMGQLAYFVLTGKVPFGSTKSLDEFGYDIELAEWVGQLRNSDPAERPVNALECLEALRALRAGSLFVSESNMPTERRRTHRRQPMADGLKAEAENLQ